MPPRRAKAMADASRPRQTQARRVKCGPLPTGPGTPDASAAAPAGRTAAREVYETLDIRRMIYTLLDRWTLITLLRLEKGGVASVADILYKAANIADMKRLTRKSPRREAYCGSVQILDISPLASPTTKTWYFEGLLPPPVLFDPETLLDNLASWTSTFPRLNTIRNKYPSSPADDVYTVQLRADGIHVDLRSCVGISPSAHPFPPHGPSLPAAPAHDGMIFHHTIGIYPARLAAGDLGPFAGNGVTMLPNIRKWRTWLFYNESLDQRISSIEYFHALAGENIGLPREDHIGFLVRRKAQGCEPIVALEAVISTYLSPVTFDELRRITVAVGPALRVLELHSPALVEAGDLRTFFTVLDTSLPVLEELSMVLTVGGHLCRSQYRPLNTLALADLVPPSPGLFNLRKLCLGVVQISPDPRLIARYLSRLGSESCVYRFEDLRNKKLIEEFNQMVRNLKKSVDRSARS